MGPLGPGAHNVFFEPLKHLWLVGGLILNVISSLLPSSWDVSFAFRHGVSFLVRCKILLSMVVQQWVAILEFSQEKMSAWLSSPLPLSYLSSHRNLTKLIVWITALSNSMELWAMSCRATQDRVMVESSDKTRSTGDGNGKPLQYSCLENLMNSMKMQKDMILKDEHPRLVGAQYATGEEWRNNSWKNEEAESKQKQHFGCDWWWK